MTDHRDESLIDKVKNAFGMGDDHDEHADHDHGHETDVSATDDRADGWAGVPEALYEDPAGAPGARAPYDPASETADSGHGRNPGRIGGAEYEDGASPADFGGADTRPDPGFDATREDASATEFGGAYGEDDTPMPTSAAWDRGESRPDQAPTGEASFGSEEEIDLDRRETGI